MEHAVVSWDQRSGRWTNPPRNHWEPQSSTWHDGTNMIGREHSEELDLRHGGTSAVSHDKNGSRGLKQYSDRAQRTVQPQHCSSNLSDLLPLFGQEASRHPDRMPSWKEASEAFSYPNQLCGRLEPSAEQQPMDYKVGSELGSLVISESQAKPNPAAATARQSPNSLKRSRGDLSGMH